MVQGRTQGMASRQTICLGPHDGALPGIDGAVPSPVHYLWIRSQTEAGHRPVEERIANLGCHRRYHLMVHPQSNPDSRAENVDKRELSSKPFRCASLSWH